MRNKLSKTLVICCSVFFITNANSDEKGAMLYENIYKYPQMGVIHKGIVDYGVFNEPLISNYRFRQGKLSAWGMTDPDNPMPALVKVQGHCGYEIFGIVDMKGPKLKVRELSSVERSGIKNYGDFNIPTTAKDVEIVKRWNLSQ